MYEQIPVLDAKGNPMYEKFPVLDDNGDTIPILDAQGKQMYEQIPDLDANGNQIYEKVPELDNGKTIPILDDNGFQMYEQFPILDANGKQIVYQEQQYNMNGLPLYSNSAGYTWFVQYKGKIINYVTCKVRDVNGKIRDINDPSLSQADWLLIENNCPATTDITHPWTIDRPQSTRGNPLVRMVNRPKMKNGNPLIQTVDGNPIMQNGNPIVETLSGIVIKFTPEINSSNNWNILSSSGALFMNITSPQVSIDPYSIADIDMIYLQTTTSGEFDPNNPVIPVYFNNRISNYEIEPEPYEIEPKKNNTFLILLLLLFIFFILH
jgi:hypothetical protein